VVRFEEPLAGLLGYLKGRGYRFVAVTPATHARVLARPPEDQLSLRDIFGWNRPFQESDVDDELLALLRAAGAVECSSDKLRSRFRMASLGEELLLHGAFPTDSTDSVFFGPDTYRFTRFVEEQLPRLGDVGWMVDMGTGSGAGAIAAAKSRDFARITMIDVNPTALHLARVNAAVAGVASETLLADAIPAGTDLVIANPPYMIDPAGRSYRDGKGLYGGEVSLNWTGQALAALAPGGTMLLYTGAAYAGGRAPLLEQLANACAGAGASLEFAEIDPDVFGEELDQPHYRHVERIAAVGIVIKAAA
jgi:methylase of polypeptide subunit release factors